MADVPVICIVSAVSNTGKTTLMEKLIGEMVQRGYKVGAVKSDCHGFEVDQPGKDSWRFTQAGAQATAIIGLDQYVLIQQTSHKIKMDQVIQKMENVDIVLVEGFKMANKPKIEVVRREKGVKIVSAAEELIAVVTDVTELSITAPIFALDDLFGVVDLIVERYL